MRTTRINYSPMQDNEGPRPEPARVADDAAVSVAEPLNPLPTIHPGTPTSAFVGGCQFIFVSQHPARLSTHYTLRRTEGPSFIVKRSDVTLPSEPWSGYAPGDVLTVSIRVSQFNHIVRTLGPSCQRGPVAAVKAKPAPVAPQSTDINDYFEA